MIDKQWMQAYAYEVKRCPKCHQKSFCLIFSNSESGDIWECAENRCGFSPNCPNCR